MPLFQTRDVPSVCVLLSALYSHNVRTSAILLEQAHPKIHVRKNRRRPSIGLHVYCLPFAPLSRWHCCSNKWWKLWLDRDNINAAEYCAIGIVPNLKISVCTKYLPLSYLNPSGQCLSVPLATFDQSVLSQHNPINVLSGFALSGSITGPSTVNHWFKPSRRPDWIHSRTRINSNNCIPIFTEHNTNVAQYQLNRQFQWTKSRQPMESSFFRDFSSLIVRGETMLGICCEIPS